MTTNTNDIEYAEFVDLLVSRGWKRSEAEQEWDAIQEDDESGYDGP